MELIAVSKCVTMHMDHTAVLVMMGINSMAMASHAEVRNQQTELYHVFTASACFVHACKMLQTLMNVPMVLMAVLRYAPTQMEATAALVDLAIVYQVTVTDVMVST